MDDKIEIFFTFDPTPDAVLDRKDLPKPIIKISAEPDLQKDAKRTIR